MTDAPELKPCPFCGGSNLDPFRTEFGDYTFSCDCGAEGPTTDRILERENLWNTRADLPPTDEQIMAHPKVRALVDALEPFSEIAGEMFARNWNDNGVAISLVVKGGAMRITFKEFRILRAALAALKGADE